MSEDGKIVVIGAGSTGAQLFNATLTGGILGGISVAEGYVLVPFGGSQSDVGLIPLPVRGRGVFSKLKLLD